MTTQDAINNLKSRTYFVDKNVDENYLMSCDCGNCGYQEFPIKDMDHHTTSDGMWVLSTAKGHLGSM